MTAIELLAPAKINLGLEILGKRRDGYHEIRTVLQTISLLDRLTISPADAWDVWSSDPRIDRADDLAWRALSAYRALTTLETPVRIVLRKRIPSAAGLGGASSDAAAALAGLHAIAATSTNVHELAASLGSDVPFFLRGGTALASGRGDVLRPIVTAPGFCGVLIVPKASIERKTATLYAALTPANMTDGAAVSRAAVALGRGLLPDPADLRNAFHGPMAELLPSIRDIAAAMTSAGARHVFLSGAGPALYAITAGPVPAHRLAHRLRLDLTDVCDVFAWRTVASGVLRRSLGAGQFA